MNYIETVGPRIRELRVLMVSNWGKAEAINHKTDSAWSIVTAIDIEVEKRMSGALAQDFPHIEFVGEESGGDRTATTFWLMDPIDGTMHYSRGLPFCTSMIALIENGQVVFGMIYDFLNDNMYYAEKGKGAFCNNVPIRVSERPLRKALLSFESRTDLKNNHLLYTTLRAKCDVIKTYSAGFEFAMIASGKLDGRLCQTPWGSDYDFAPGCLLVQEAGGIVANIGTTSYDYRNLDFIATNKDIFDELTKGSAAIFPLQ